MRKNWSIHPKEMKFEKNKGIKITNPTDYNIGGLTYEKMISGATRWEIDVAIQIGAMNPA